MGENEQKRTKTDVLELTPQQALAVDMLSSGRTITDVAAALALRRQTVSDWLNHNPMFQAELNARRQELWVAASDRLRTLADRAIGVLEECLESEGELRFKSAVQILKCSGLYGALVPQGPTDVEDVEIAQRRTTYDRLLRGLAAGE
jgi:hypothetical protein